MLLELGEGHAKDMDPETRNRMEQRNEKFNEDREVARQRMDEELAQMEAKRLKKQPVSGKKFKEGQQF